MPSPDEKVVKNRVHLDLNPGADATPAEREAEIERLIALGARRVDVGQGEDETWTVLADPEGNEFCVVRPKADLGRRAGQRRQSAGDPQCGRRACTTSTAPRATSTSAMTAISRVDDPVPGRPASGRDPGRRRHCAAAAGGVRRRRPWTWWSSAAA